MLKACDFCVFFGILSTSNYFPIAIDLVLDDDDDDDDDDVFGYSRVVDVPHMRTPRSIHEGIFPDLAASFGSRLLPSTPAQSLEISNQAPLSTKIVAGAGPECVRSI